MELIYFISGILTVGTVYGVLLLRKVKSSHASLLESSQHSSNIYSVRYKDMQDKLNDMTEHMNSIKGLMEKDSYENLTKTRKKIGTIENDIIGIQKTLNNDINTTEKSFNKGI